MLLATLILFLNAAFAQVPTPEEAAPPPTEGELKIESSLKSISTDERKQREAMSHLFVLNKNLRDLAKKQETLNQKTLDVEAQVKTLAQDVSRLENKREEQKEMLNRRLRQLYQQRGRGDYSWIFTAGTPVELERNHRYLKLMIDSDQRQLKTYLDDLAQLAGKRGELKVSVAKLLSLRKSAVAQEKELNRQQNEKAAFVEKIKSSTELKLGELKNLRAKTAAAGYAFFERRGELAPPVDAMVTRAYGSYVDPKYRFRLEQKGNFYGLRRRENVHAVFKGKVVFAANLPGYGPTVIVDHGDNYYTVYAYATDLRVKVGARVNAGEIVASSGQGSPLFGPGLYFEIRHFTDAIDPRPWIKDSGIRTAETQAD